MFCSVISLLGYIFKQAYQIFRLPVTLLFLSLGLCVNLEWFEFWLSGGYSYYPDIFIWLTRPDANLSSSFLLLFLDCVMTCRKRWDNQHRSVRFLSCFQPRHGNNLTDHVLLRTAAHCSFHAGEELRHDGAWSENTIETWDFTVYHTTQQPGIMSKGLFLLRKL